MTESIKEQALDLHVSNIFQSFNSVIIYLQVHTYVYSFSIQIQRLQTLYILKHLIIFHIIIISSFAFNQLKINNQIKMLDGFFNLISNNVNSNNAQQKLQTLRGQLYTCTYPNNIKFLIEKICMDVMKEYPAFTTQILAFVQNNQSRRFIQIGGNFAYQYKGKMRKVKIFMMFNQFFPQKSPYLRIFNADNQQASDHYNGIKSHNDPQSYVLNKKLSKLASWHPASDCVSIFAQAKYYLQTYPFYVSDLQSSTKIEKKKQIFVKEKEKPQDEGNRKSYYQSSQTQSKKQTKNGQNEDDYNAKQCKLCYDNTSNMINLSCAHVMMCEECFQLYKKKFNSEVLECPICKTKGQYVKFVQPKFA